MGLQEVESRAVFVGGTLSRDDGNDERDDFPELVLVDDAVPILIDGS
jgi:hypothetical protein